MIRGTKSPHGLALAADQLTHSGAFGARDVTLSETPPAQKDIA